MTPTAPSIAEVLLATFTPTVTETPLPETPTPALPTPALPTQAVVTDEVTGAIITAQPASGVQVYVTVRQRAWMRALVDGVVEFEGRVIPGSAYPFAGETSIEIQTSNGAGLQLQLNGVDLGVMGALARWSAAFSASKAR